MEHAAGGRRRPTARLDPSCWHTGGSSLPLACSPRAEPQCRSEPDCVPGTVMTGSLASADQGLPAVPGKVPGPPASPSCALGCCNPARGQTRLFSHGSQLAPLAPPLPPSLPAQTPKSQDRTRSLLHSAVPPNAYHLSQVRIEKLPAVTTAPPSAAPGTCWIPPEVGAPTLVCSCTRAAG